MAQFYFKRGMCLNCGFEQCSMVMAYIMLEVLRIFQAMCVSNGASLVNVENQEEHEFLKSILLGLASV